MSRHRKNLLVLFVTIWFEKDELVLYICLDRSVSVDYGR